MLHRDRDMMQRRSHGLLEIEKKHASWGEYSSQISISRITIFLCVPRGKGKDCVNLSHESLGR